MSSTIEAGQIWRHHGGVHVVITWPGTDAEPALWINPCEPSGEITGATAPMQPPTQPAWSLVGHAPPATGRWPS